MSLDYINYLQSLNRRTNEILIRIEVLLQKLLESQVISQQKIDQYLNLLVSAGLETSPNVTRSVVVGTTQVELARNDSAPSTTFNIANLDTAQPLWVGLESVTTQNGRVINPRENANIVVPIGRALYGITDVGTIDVVVSQLNSLIADLKNANI